MIRRRFLGASAGLLGVARWGVAAAGGAISLVVSERSEPYSVATEWLLTELERDGIARGDIVQSVVSESGSLGAVDASPGRLVVALGAVALERVLQSDVRGSVLAAMIPRTGYEFLRKSAASKSLSISALYLDQPIARQLELVRLALPNTRRVGVLWGPESVRQQSTVSAAMQARGMELVSGVVEPNAPLYPALKMALDAADVLLAVADVQVFNASTVSNILQATYRERVPVLAFSPAYVKAGALLSVHSSAGQIGRQAASFVRTYLQTGVLTAPQYSQEFDIGVNEHVARSLGLSLDSQSLALRLRRLERRS